MRLKEKVNYVIKSKEHYQKFLEDLDNQGFMHSSFPNRKEYLLRPFCRHLETKKEDSRMWCNLDYMPEDWAYSEYIRRNCCKPYCDRPTIIYNPTKEIKYNA